MVREKHDFFMYPRLTHLIIGIRPKVEQCLQQDSNQKNERIVIFNIY